MTIIHHTMGERERPDERSFDAAWSAPMWSPTHMISHVDASNFNNMSDLHVARMIAHVWFMNLLCCLGLFKPRHISVNEMSKNIKWIFQ